ncbi:MAG: hypothetical protein C0482_18190 [Gordonia sp.]|uniref:Uncharacterized protein n=1 Tax=Gordonia rubripertincta TaxID=36822 RepID=A0ABT4N433_GORRU|nr:hypothetical protein [Gordonia rubripertincta]MBA4024290.1 hypothetical protein [Gordonia sp. (in: high G+C Gram-positive bacteria)]MCZ4553076.1 hypothetical protein [Gordonia rubripertincta]
MTAADTMMLTIFLRHDQSQNLEQLQGRLDDSDWWHGFPPEGCEVVSWVVAMGIGQIVTLRLPADRLAAVNVELERRAWGTFRTEFYPTYDFSDVHERLTRESDARRAVGTR